MEKYIELHSWLLDPDRFPVALAAMLLTAIIGMITGPMHGNANPFYWKFVNVLFGKMGRRLDRTERKASDLLFRGLILTLIALILSYGLGKGADQLVMEVPLKGASEILILSLLLTSGTVWFGLLKLYFALSQNQMGKGAYYSIAHSTRTDLSTSDDFVITRVGMGFAARAFDKGLVAPVIWYLIAGLPGAFMYSCLSALAWRFGKSGFSKGFGNVAMALERLMGFVPTMFSGLLIAFAGLFTPTGGMTRAIVSLLQQDKKTKYEQGGLPLTAMAYSLGVSLGGPTIDLDGSALKSDWIGPEGATAQLESAHLRRAIYITLMAYLLFLVSLLGSMLWAGRLF